MMSKFFVEHPILANGLAIVLIAIGAVSLVRLPVSEYPNIVPPTVQVTTSYPGASAETVGDLQVVTSGLGRDDRIIVGELWRVNPGMKVTPKLTRLDALNQ